MRLTAEQLSAISKAINKLASVLLPIVKELKSKGYIDDEGNLTEKGRAEVRRIEL